MAWMWTIFREVGPDTELCIQREIRERAEFFELSYEMSPVMARGKAVGEVHREVKKRFREGGVDAVRQWYGTAS